MMSVFDWSEMQNVDRAWAGREWFVVRKAEVRIAEDMGGAMGRKLEGSLVGLV